MFLFKIFRQRYILDLRFVVWKSIAISQINRLIYHCAVSSFRLGCVIETIEIVIILINETILLSKTLEFHINIMKILEQVSNGTCSALCLYVNASLLDSIVLNVIEWSRLQLFSANPEFQWIVVAAAKPATIYLSGVVRSWCCVVRQCRIQARVRAPNHPHMIFKTA